MNLGAVERLAAPASFADKRVALATAIRFVARNGLYASIVLSPFRARFYIEERRVPGIFTDYTDLLLFWSEVVVLAVLALWVLSLLLQPRRIDFGPLFICIPVALIAVAMFVSVPFSTERSLALYNAVTILGFMLLALYALNEIKYLAQLLPAVVLMVVIQAVVAITQVISQDSFGLIPIGEFNLDPADAGRSVLWTEGHPRLLRGYGLSDHPNILGGVLAAALLVILAALPVLRNARNTTQTTVSFQAQREPRREASPLRDAFLVIACGAFGLGFAGLTMTFSRGAAIGFAAGFVIAFLLLLVRRDWHAIATWLAACVIATIVSVPLLMPYTPYLGARINPGDQPVGSTEERSLTERDVLMRQTNEIFLDSPLTGVGPGVLPTAMKENYPDSRYLFGPAHVAVLTVAAEIGILGVTAYGLLILAPFVLLWTRRHSLTPELIAMTGAVVALSVVGLFDYYTWSLNSGRFWFWLVLGLWLVAYRRGEEQPADA